MHSPAASNAQIASVADNLGDNLVIFNSTAAPTTADGHGVAATAATFGLETPDLINVTLNRGRA